MMKYVINGLVLTSTVSNSKPRALHAAATYRRSPKLFQQVVLLLVLGVWGGGELKRITHAVDGAEEK